MTESIIYISGTALVGLLTWWLNRRKSEAEIAYTWASANSEFAAATAQLVATVAALNTSVQERDNRLDRVEEQARSKDRQIMDMEQKIDHLEHLLAEKDQEIEWLNAEVERLKQTRDDYQQTAERLTDEKAALVQQLAVYQHGHESNPTLFLTAPDSAIRKSPGQSHEDEPNVTQHNDRS